MALAQLCPNLRTSTYAPTTGLQTRVTEPGVVATVCRGRTTSGNLIDAAEQESNDDDDDDDDWKSCLLFLLTKRERDEKRWKRV